MNKSKLAIVIVAYKNMECLAECLASIPPLSWIEVIVVDNSNNNRGFARGCNLGARLTQAPFILFLNPDSRVSAKALRLLLDTLQQNAQIGMVGPKLVDINGKSYMSYSLQPSPLSAALVYSFLNKWLPQLPVIRRHWMGTTPSSTMIDVGIISGAAIAMRRSVFDQLRGFDERFFLYWEEVDFCRRVLEAGLRVVFQPAAVIFHAGGLSTIQPRGQVLKWFRTTRSQFFHKHFGPVYGYMLDVWFFVAEKFYL